MMLKLDIEYEFGNEVYLIADPDQERVVIIGYDVLPGNQIKYKISSMNYTASFYGFEITSEKSVII